MSPPIENWDEEEMIWLSYSEMLSTADFIDEVLRNVPEGHPSRKRKELWEKLNSTKKKLNETIQNKLQTSEEDK